MSNVLDMPTRTGAAGAGDHAALARDIAALLSPAAAVRADEPMAKRTTLRVGGPADVYAEPASEDDLSKLLLACAERGLPWRMLGRGSNLLVRDGGVRGVVISLSRPAFGRLEPDGTRLRCGAGTSLKNIAQEARRQSLTGLEFLEGIPGTVGGALRMNAGAMGGATFDVIETVRFMDPAGAVHERPRTEVPVQYRGCPLFVTHIALGAVFKGEFAPRHVVECRMAASNQKRWTSQPRQPSAGCIFKNPSTLPAGKLVDELGLKGTRRGGAMVSDVHGNFIVNEGHATAGDVLELIALIKVQAKTDRGIELETEVEIIGED